MTKRIPVFLSVGEAHNEIQRVYIKTLKEYLLERGILAETLGQTFYDLRNPLRPVSEKMQRVFGAIILAMERFHSFEGSYKENSKKQKDVSDQYFSTVWNQIEGSMADLLDLPLLILKESKIVNEGIFDAQIHEWQIIRINPANPKEIFEDPIKSYIEKWIFEVNKKFYTST